MAAADPDRWRELRRRYRMPEFSRWRRQFDQPHEPDDDRHPDRPLLVLGADVPHVLPCPHPLRSTTLPPLLGRLVDRGPLTAAAVCRQCDGRHAHRWAQVDVPPSVRRDTSLGELVRRCVVEGCWPCLTVGCLLRMGHREPWHDYGDGCYR